MDTKNDSIELIPLKISCLCFVFMDFSLILNGIYATFIFDFMLVLSIVNPRITKTIELATD